MIKDYYNDFKDFSFNKQTIVSFLEVIGDKDLYKYYRLAETTDFDKIISVEDAQEMIETPYEIMFDDEYKALVYIDKNGTKKPLYDPNENNFSLSDKWASQYLKTIEILFPGATAGSLSIEQENMYICACIAGVFKGPFKDQFMERFDSYNFKDWKGAVNAFGEVENWEHLYNEWSSDASIGVRMLISACMYKLKTEKNDAFTFRTSGLPEEVVLKLESIRDEIKLIRIRAERDELSSDKMSKLTKLEQKVAISGVDSRIKDVLNKIENQPYKEIFKVFKLSSNHMPADIKRIFARAAEKQTLSDLKEGIIDERGKDVVYLKEYMKALKKESFRAWMSRFREQQVKQYIEDPINYIAPPLQ